MFTAFFYLLKDKGLPVSLNEWMTLMEGLDKGLEHASLTGFYYLARAVLVKTEADYDRFDQAFLEYFKGVEHIEQLPKELLEWLSQPMPQAGYDKDEVDRRAAELELEDLRRMLEERLAEQHERHDGGNKWIGTGGTSPFGHSGYNPKGIRIGGPARNRSAIQIAGERHFRDFREDHTLDLRQFQLALRRLRQFSALDDGPKDVLDVDATIRETSDKAGQLSLVFTRERKNMVKLLLLFDSGGSMWPYSTLCTTLFQAVSKANHFKDLKVYYFHNCFYDKLYTTPSCWEPNAIDTEWVLKNLGSDYKVMIVGDASMAPSELLSRGGNIYYWYGSDNEPGITWIRRFTARYKKIAWLNPLSPWSWEHGYGSETIGYVKKEVPMYPLTVEGLEQATKALVKAR
ncbi:MAG: VWA domain-containing protein [Lachnospiraceae bacterium]|nr:VWA domain-containing protein [Lachnospiraceae bacterium]